MKNLQLGISAAVVMGAGLVYGFNPEGVLGVLIEIEVSGLELRNIFKAVMGLYLAFGIFWVIGILNTAYWKMATLSNVLFMGGLAFGRGVSLILDGMSPQLALAMVLELIMMFWGLFNLTRVNATKRPG